MELNVRDDYATNDYVVSHDLDRPYGVPSIVTDMVYDEGFDVMNTFIEQQLCLLNEWFANYY
jgi:hypothetical protein